MSTELHPLFAHILKAHGMPQSSDDSTEHFEIRYYGYNGQAEDCWGAWEECSEEDYLHQESRHYAGVEVRKWTEPRATVLESIDRRQTQRRTDATADLLAQADRRHNAERRFVDDRADTWREDWKADRIAEDRDRDTANWGQR